VFHYHASGHCNLYKTLPRWQQWFFRRAFFHADGAIRISTLTPDDARQLEARNEYIVPNGIVDPCLANPPSRAALPVTELRPLRLLFIALLCEGKGLLVLLDACGELARRGVPFHLDVMGRFESDEFEARVRRQVTELNIEDRVTFLGVLIGDEKFEVFRKSDVLCHPTFFDTFPVVILEAMACGMPTVATRWSGIPSIVDHEVTGFLVETHNPSAVADRVTQLADSPQLRQQMGDAAREKFIGEFTLPGHIERIRLALLDVAGKRPTVEPATPQHELAEELAEATT
jgi:glycosyltransferase involved in cell wall biosynthesis